MSQSLRKMLNSNRVRKRPQSSPFAGSSYPRRSSASSSGGQKRPAAAMSKSSPASVGSSGVDDWSVNAFFDDTEPLPDAGLADIFADQTLRDIPQALAWGVSHMWSPLPTREGTTLSATSARAQSFRRQLPPMASIGHVGAILKATTPAALERETAELRREGIVRRVEVPRRGGGGEGLILASELERMVREKVPGQTGEAWMQWLREVPMAMTVTIGANGKDGKPAITTVQADELVRAGFLTADHGDGALADVGYGSRAADKGTLLSLAAVGRGLTLDEAGVPGVAPRTSHAAYEAEVLRVAVPGHGTLLKIADLAVERLAELLRKTQHKEAPESVLRERWDGGAVAVGETQRRHGVTFSNFGTPPHRTRKWKEFYGLSFDWVLLEAIGTGVVEAFETGSVGRAVRLLS